MNTIHILHCTVIDTAIIAQMLSRPNVRCIFVVATISQSIVKTTNQLIDKVIIKLIDNENNI